MTTIITLAELVTTSTVDDVLALELSVATQLNLPVTSWQPLDPSRTILQVNANLVSQESAVVAGIAQGGFASYAAIMPAGMPIRMEKVMAVRASSSVAGTRSTINPRSAKRRGALGPGRTACASAPQPANCGPSPSSPWRSSSSLEEYTCSPSASRSAPPNSVRANRSLAFSK